MRSLQPREQTQSRWPYIITAVIISLAMTILVGRLWYLQLFRTEYYRDMSEHNRIRLQDVAPVRGRIFDRNGILLVDNQPAFDLAIVREDVSDMEKLLTDLERLLLLDPEEIRARLKKKRGAPPFVPIVIKPHLAWDDVARLETYKYEMPGLSLLTEPKRDYRYPFLAAHLIGYTGEVTARQLKQNRYINAKPGDRVGQYGLEMAYNFILAGKHGGRQVEVDATGRPLKVLRRVPSRSGQDLHLTIDARLQRTAERALDGKAGAIVALEVNTGQVLAMASSPSFDQSDFVTGLTPEKWQALIKDPFHPLDNRAISGQYPPGTTFKIVMATAALMEGVISPETTVFCPGHYRFAGRNYHCWKRGGHGKVDFHRALVESCDVYFYRVGQKLGVDRIAKYARLYGLGSRTGIELANEKPGLVPSTKWKRKRYSEKWHKGETLSISIGQGFNLVTPLQLARMTAALANGGKLVKPTLILRQPQAKDGSEKAAAKTAEPEPKSLNVSSEVLARVRAALKDVVHGRRGTARVARIKGLTIGGKTGTAQVVRLEKFKHLKNELDIPYRYRDHALFVAFAPTEKPEIAVAVLVEHGLHGGSAAAPLARDVIASYFKLKNPAAETDKENSLEQGPQKKINNQPEAKPKKVPGEGVAQ